MTRRPGPPNWLAHFVAGAVLVLLVASFVAVWANKDVLGIVVFTATPPVLLAVGWLLAWKQPRNPLGWLLIGVCFLMVVPYPIGLLGQALMDSAPGVAAWLLWYGAERDGAWDWTLLIGLLFVHIPLRFPDGRLPSPRWRWFFGFTIGAILLAGAILATEPAEVIPGVPNPAHIPGIAQSGSVADLLMATPLAISIVGAIASLFVRYRRGDATQRAQLRWVLWAVSTVGLLLVTSWAFVVPLEIGTGDWAPFGISYALIPIAMAVAVLRYRLYSIDRIISRTATYAIVTLLVVGVYAIVVTSATWLLPELAAVGVALATLTAAAIFLPVLRWVRRWIDRRFDRERYDAEKVVDAFGERLRTGADPATSTPALLAAVERALQPASVGLWTVGGRR